MRLDWDRKPDSTVRPWVVLGECTCRHKPMSSTICHQHDSRWWRRWWTRWTRWTMFYWVLLQIHMRYETHSISRAHVLRGSFVCPVTRMERCLNRDAVGSCALRWINYIHTCERHLTRKRLYCNMVRPAVQRNTKYNTALIVKNSEQALWRNTLSLVTSAVRSVYRTDVLCVAYARAVQ